MWFTKAAVSKNIEAMREVAYGYNEFRNEYKEALGIVTFGYDEDKEIYWLLKAALLEDSISQLKIASKYYYKSNFEDAIYWYNKAVNSTQCDIQIKAYKGLVDIYGNIGAVDYYNSEKEKMMLTKLLTIKQDNLNNFKAYDDESYEDAAFLLGIKFEDEYRSTSDNTLLRKAVYCFLLSYYYDNRDSHDKLHKLNYVIGEDELRRWIKDAKKMNFCLPE